MNVRIHNVPENGQFADCIRERIQVILQRYSKQLSHTEVTIRNLNDSRTPNGNLTECRIELSLNPRGHLQVCNKNGSGYLAVNGALHRAEQLLAKHLQKQRRLQRSRKTQAKRLDPIAAVTEV